MQRLHVTYNFGCKVLYNLPLASEW